MFYSHIIKPILFQFDPEKVHDFFTIIGKNLGDFSIGRTLAKLFYGYSGPDISRTINGVYYKTPIILSAGFDYNAHLTTILPSLSFGGVEIGSVTARPCEGNPKPRLTRLPRSKSIIVNKGLRNDGVDTIIARLKNKKKIKNFVIGVSIARTNDEKSSSIEAGINDYLTSFKKLNEADVGDYYTLNISCPNAFGGETFAKPELLSKLLAALSSVVCYKPIYVKMPINLMWNEFHALLEIIEKFNIAGVIIGNLNKDYGALAARNEAPKSYQGGLSGKPCFSPSNVLIRETRKAYGNRFTIIGCGGILSPKDAMEKFSAGADLVELITGMIYTGPSLIKAICEEYAKK